ncbi:MAG: hypothetical protein HY831_03035 [Candidatus Aenigmarchaeota archaeon]|nr:hypothetical protein [Candidatus Aenigmarchaeota archaeon]
MGWVGSFITVNVKSGEAEARQGYVCYREGIEPSQQILPGQYSSTISLFSNRLPDYFQEHVRNNPTPKPSFAGNVLFGKVNHHREYNIKREGSDVTDSFSNRLTQYQDLYREYSLDVRHYGQDDFVSVVLTRKDGTSYAGTFATSDAVREIMQKEVFAAAPGLVVVDDLSVENIRSVVGHIIERCSLDRNFVYLPNEETG